MNKNAARRMGSDEEAEIGFEGGDGVFFVLRAAKLGLVAIQAIRRRFSDKRVGSLGCRLPADGGSRRQDGGYFFEQPRLAHPDAEFYAIGAKYLDFTLASTVQLGQGRYAEARRGRGHKLRIVPQKLLVGPVEQNSDVTIRIRNGDVGLAVFIEVTHC